MATQDTTQEKVFNCVDHSPDAFKGFDSTVYLGWAKAAADVLACGGMSGVADDTPANFGSLLYSLTRAAEELAALEAKAESGEAH